MQALLASPQQLNWGKPGLSVLILEARERLGGRILTIPSVEHGFPIELGAELFPESCRKSGTFFRNRREDLEVEGDVWCADGRLLPCDFTDDVNRVLDRMDDGAPDQSFADFLQCCCREDASVDERAKERALRYVVGFNAADPEQVGVHWLAKGLREEQGGQGEPVVPSKEWLCGFDQNSPVSFSGDSRHREDQCHGHRDQVAGEYGDGVDGGIRGQELVSSEESSPHRAPIHPEDRGRREGRCD